MALCHKTLTPLMQLYMHEALGYPLTIIVDILTESNEITLVSVTHSGKLTI
jgi:hypothetical protein